MASFFHVSAPHPCMHIPLVSHACVVPRNFDLFVGIMNKIAIDIARAITPSNLLGIDRKVAYSNRKYHSG